MNKIKLLFLAVLSIVLLQACTDDEGNPVTDPTQLVPSMSATVNGVEWKATAPAAIDSAGLLVVTGFNQDDTSSIIIIVKNAQETSYNFADSAGDASAIYNGFNFASSGTLEITKFNSGQLISGNFSFNTDSTLLTTANEITAGRINNVVIVKR